MPYQINGTGIPLEPTSGRWLPRQLIAFDGNGRAIYVPTRQFQLRWQLADPGQIWQLQIWFQSIGATGTVVADLPRYRWPAYEYHSYSGVFLQEPEEAEYFNKHETEVTMLITNIRTEDV